MSQKQSSDNNKRIAKNTLLLYFRMLFMMVVSLYTSRVILDALGVKDFGIYNVVGGVVAMSYQDHCPQPSLHMRRCLHLPLAESVS